MLFSGEEGLKPTEALSGGETARLLFCRIMLQKPNVLVLDEPTNHLDLESINALNVALQKFEGTVLLVTHDQDLMEEVGTRVWHFDHGAHRRLQGHLRGVHVTTLAVKSARQTEIASAVSHEVTMPVLPWALSLLIARPPRRHPQHRPPATTSAGMSACDCRLGTGRRPSAQASPSSSS